MVRKSLKEHPPQERGIEDREGLRKVVIPYVHGVTHRLIKIGQRHGVKVIPSVKRKLSVLPGLVARDEEDSACGVSHRDR